MGLTIQVILLYCIVASYAQYPKDLASSEVPNYYKSGSTLTYYITYTNCETSTTNGITLYDYGEEIKQGYLIFITAANWGLSFGFDLEIDGKHFNLTGPAYRFANLKLDNTGKAVVSFRDYNRHTGTQLAATEFVCHMDRKDKSGLHISAQSAPGTPLATYGEIRKAIDSGNILNFGYNFMRCAVPPTAQIPTDFDVWFSGRVDGLRMNGKGQVVFTGRNIEETLISIFNIIISPDSTVQVKGYTYSKITYQSNSTYTYTCLLNKSLMMFVK